MKAVRFVMLAAAVAIPLSGHTLRVESAGVPVITTVAHETQRVALHIEGMTCGGCAISARVALNRLEGVQKTEVSYEQKRALVTYDPSRVTPQQMIAALKQKLGYTARVIDAGAR